MGIEAISRGAAHCVFVENDRAALAVLRSNIATLGISEKSTVIAGDAVGTAAHQQEIDLLIADPPYGFNAWDNLLSAVSASLVVLESGRPIGPIAGFETVREKKYGRTHVAFLSPSSAPEGTVEVQ
jgi:16S rRNA (guanine966-N2)-methyltransferase